MRRIARGVLVLAAILVAFAATLVVLSEWGEVVVLHSRHESGELRATRLWVVDDGGTAWLRASGRERGWFTRVAVNPEVELERGGERGPFNAIVVDTPETVARVSALMREKYGFTDALIEFVEGGWTPVAVRLDARGAPPAR
jgi:hypothetical protein